MNQLLTELMVFAAIALGEPIPDKLPNIKYHPTQCSLDRDYMRDPTRTCDPEQMLVAAFYRTPEDAIYLTRSFKRDSPWDKSVLVHELVHFIQDQAGHFQKVSCAGELEPPAYEVQDKWLKEQGLSLARFGVTRVRIALASQCPNPWEEVGHAN